MKIIDIKDVDNYRLAIAKAVFLKVYENIELVEDIPNSSCMKVKENNQVKYISLFKKPTDKNVALQTHEIYYEKGTYAENDNKHKLNTDFEELYRHLIKMAFTSPDEMFDRIDDSNALLFKALVIDDANSVDDTAVYKYYSSKIADNDEHGNIDGKVYFTKPTVFNDPFDCNCIFSNNTDMSDLFHVLCVTSRPDNILMWSYYGENHNGYCFKYSKKDIVQCILNLKNPGLCIMGNVKYKNDRPNIITHKSTLSFSEVNTYINATITKYIEWDHEQEFRFIIISDDPAMKKQTYFGQKLTVDEIFGGCNSSVTTLMDSSGRLYHAQKYQKHDAEYKLILHQKYESEEEV